MGPKHADDKRNLEHEWNIHRDTIGGSSSQILWMSFTLPEDSHTIAPIPCRTEGASAGSGMSAKRVDAQPQIWGMSPIQITCALRIQIQGPLGYERIPT